VCEARKSADAESDAPKPAVFKRLGMPSIFSPHIGTQEFLLAQHALNEEGVARTTRQVLEIRVLA
jgi:hypothetical protein